MLTKLEFTPPVSVKAPVPNFTKIRPAGVQMFHGEG
jgi:hypothetical protein